MRLLRLRLADFYQGRELRLQLSDAPADPALTFLVGPNGTGKSRVLESLGRLFSHLSAGVPPGLDFDLEYEVNDRRVLVTTREPPLAGQAAAAVSPTKPETWLLVCGDEFSGWRREHVRPEWPTDSELDTVLPFRVLGLSTGPASRLDWALRAAVADSYAQRLDTLETSAPADAASEEWEAYDESERESLSRAIRVAGSESRCIALSGQELSLAVLSLLAHPGVAERKDTTCEKLLERIGLHPRESLRAFAFEVAADWQERLLRQEHRGFEALLGQAARRLALDALSDPESNDLGEREQRVVFQVDEELRRWLGGVADSPFVWFSQLLGWLKAGAIDSLRLVIKKDGTSDLLLDSDFSDGEFLLAGRYGLLLLLREHRDFLVLFDEPETHFNDQWKVSLVNDLVQILEGSGSQVLIATHSDITISDAERSAVHILDRSGEEDAEAEEARHPPLSPFAANRSSITTGVFEAPAGTGQFALEAVDEALESGDPEQLRRMLERVGPGFHQFRLQLRLAEAEEDEEERDAG